MTSKDALTELLKSFREYYDISTENVLQPFSATAEFHLFNQQYFLVKQARISESDSHDYVYFALPENLTEEKLTELDSIAWQNGISKVRPYFGHRNTDVTLIIIADKIDDEVFKTARHHKHDLSYKFSFYGWSQFKLIAYELSTGRFAANRLGKDLKKLFRNIEKINVIGETK